LAKTSILNGELNTHYDTMTLKDIMNLDIHTYIENDALLFLWVVSPMLDDGIELMKKWGFKYATIAFVWYKQKTNPGHYTMSECEICLVGKKGKIPSPRGSRNVKQFLNEMRGKHSKKPDEIRNRITQMFPIQNKIELFARQRIDGWDSIGFDIDGKNIQDVLKEMSI
jgi:N6-adenosine-specific RNA methylase IME4